MPAEKIKENQNPHKIEILSPCGNRECFDAAVNAGADAVFLAGNSFGARAYAGNFTDEELLEIIPRAHRYGVKVYLTVNILLKDAEFEPLYRFLKPLVQAGLDAVLVQDFGVAAMIRHCFPDLPLHASTQMNITSPAGGVFAASRGFTRIVAARELTIPELTEIRRTAGVEVEAFVHGAMCFSYSGRCLMSSALGDRSGNRGRCAQPCRQKYNGAYRMSMRDMCSLSLIPALMDAGVDSLKIEGRMKNAFYVAAATEAYRRMAEDYAAGRFSEAKAEKYRFRLADTFNRGGFSSGYYGFQPDTPRDEERTKILIDRGKPGRTGVPAGVVSRVGKGEICLRTNIDLAKGDGLEIEPEGDSSGGKIRLTVPENVKSGTTVALRAPGTGRITSGTSVYRTWPAALHEEIQKKYLGKIRQLEVKAVAEFRMGLPARLTVRRGNIFCTVEGPVCQPAEKRPVDETEIRTRLMKTGNETYFFSELEVTADPGIFLPLSALGDLRRRAFAGLDEKIKKTGERDSVNIRSLGNFYASEQENGGEKEPEHSNAGEKKAIFLVTSSEEQTEAVLSVISGGREKKENVTILLNGGMGAYGDRNRLEKGLRDLRELHVSVGFLLPLIRRTNYTLSDYEKAADLSDTVMLQNLEDYGELCSLLEKRHPVWYGKIIILGGGLYAYNCHAAGALYRGLPGAGDILFDMPEELSLQEMEALFHREEKTGIPGSSHILRQYGRTVVSVTDAWPTAGRHRETRLSGAGTEFERVSVPELWYNVVLGQRTLQQETFPVRSLVFTTESGKEVLAVLQAVKGKGKMPFPVRSGLTRGIL